MIVGKMNILLKDHRNKLLLALLSISDGEVRDANEQ